MPIMAAHERSDARGTARLLAGAARDCIRNPAIAPDSEVVLNNVFRLLESYRTLGLQAPARKRPEGVRDSLSLMPPPERHVNEVKVALERAVASAFAGETKDDAINTVESVLQALAYPGHFQQPSDAERTKATRFFEDVIRNLKLD